ncbi:MAG: GntR family transcriptional regulator [Gammaproteobacteria bacterium]
MSKAVEQAYGWIRGRILSGEFPSGMHLKEERIAEESKVSRTPVREALRRLSNRHYVKFIPNQGAFVATWADDDVEVIFELRSILEGYSAFRAATRISDEDIAEMERCADAIEKLCVHHSFENHRNTIEFNHRFHTIIIEAASSERINKMLNWLVEIPLLLRTIDRYSDADVERSNHHHRELIEAFKARDGRWAQGVMELHLRAAYQIYTSSPSEDASRKRLAAKAV